MMAISPSATAAELTRLRTTLARRSITAVLLSEPSSICYASRFAVPLPIGAGTAFAAGPNLAAVGTAGGSALLVSGAEASQARRQNELEALFVYSAFGHFSAVDGRTAFLEAFLQTLRQVVPTSGVGTLGIEPRTLPSIVLTMLTEHFPHLQLVDATAAIAEARMIKSAREIALIRSAVAAADAGQRTLQEQARAGVSEIELWSALCSSIEETARQPVPISGELVSGPRSSVVDYPGGPLARRLQPGDTIICDISPCVAGYYADCCNTLVIGDPSADQLRYFRAARDAWEAAVEQLRPGCRACDAAQAAADAFTRHGLPTAHYTGHSIGTAVNESPRLVQYDRTPIEAGMVFAVEPGAYAGPEGVTGSRVEKVILVTASGPEVVSQFPWGLK